MTNELSFSLQYLSLTAIVIVLSFAKRLERNETLSRKRVFKISCFKSTL